MSLVRKSLFASLGQAGVVILNLAGTILFARKLGHDLGQYDLFRNVAAMAIAVAAMGLGNANMYMLNARRVPLADLLGNGLVVLAVGGISLLALVPALVLGLPGYFGEVRSLVAAVFALGVVGLLGSALLRPLVVARLAIGWSTAGDLAAPVLVLAGGLALFMSGNLRASSAICLLAVGAIASAAISSVYLFSSSQWHVRTNLGLFRETLSHGLRFFASNALQMMIGTSIVVILRLLTKDDPGFGPIALYTRAAALSGLSLVLPVAIGPMLFATWAGMAPERRHEQVEFATRVTLLYLLVTSAVLVLGGSLLLKSLYGPLFVAAQPALIVMVAGNAIFAIYSVFLNLFASNGQIGLVGWIHGGGVTVGCLMSWLLIPSLGAVGAAAALFSAHLFCCGCAIIVGLRHYGVDPRRCLVIRTSDLRVLWSRVRKGARA